MTISILMTMLMLCKQNAGDILLCEQAYQECVETLSADRFFVGDANKVCAEIIIDVLNRKENIKEEKNENNNN